MARIFILLAAAWLGVATPAFAQPRVQFPTRVTAAILARLCEREIAPCLGYVIGVADSYASALAGSGRPQLFCIPQGATNEEIRQVAVRFVNAHPEEAAANASIVVLAALRAAYPCTR